jgi:uncharacterized membrane-anchored protein
MRQWMPLAMPARRAREWWWWPQQGASHNVTMAIRASRHVVRQAAAYLAGGHGAAHLKLALLLEQRGLLPPQRVLQLHAAQLRVIECCGV